MDVSMETWHISRHATPEYAPQFGVYVEESDNDLAIVVGENAEVRANLIGAAPALLHELEDTRPYIVEHAQRCTDSECAHRSTLQAADAAIEKARATWP